MKPDDAAVLNSRLWVRTTLLVMLLVAALLRIVGLADAPPGLYQDEAANAWNTKCLLYTGRDQVGVSWPIMYTRALGANRTTLYIYLSMPFQAIGGMNVWTTRLPSVVFGIATIGLIYYLASRWFGVVTGLIAAGLLTLNPWHVHLSRFGHEGSIGPFLILAPVAALVWAGFPVAGTSPDHGRLYPGRAALAGVIAAVASYGYPSARMILPFLLFALVTINLKDWRRLLATTVNRKALLALALVFLILWGPLVVTHLTDSAINKRAVGIWVWGNDDSTFQAVAAVCKRYALHFMPGFLFRPEEPLGPEALNENLARSPFGVGRLHLYMIPLLLVGLISMLCTIRQSRAGCVVLALILLGPIGDSFHGGAQPHSLRSAPMLCGLILLAAIGAVALGRWFYRQNRWLFHIAGGFFAVAVIAFNVNAVITYAKTAAMSPDIRRLFHVDLVKAGKWLKPGLADYETVFCTNQQMNMPYVITLVMLDYDPLAWFTEPRLVDNPGAWDLYLRYGKFRFMYHEALYTPVIRQLSENGQPDRVLFIVRPGEVPQLSEPVFRVLDPSGNETLLLFDKTL